MRAARTKPTVYFWYTDGDVKTQVFRDFNLQIPAGQRVGLVGMSGAGHTGAGGFLSYPKQSRYFFYFG